MAPRQTKTIAVDTELALLPSNCLKVLSELLQLRLFNGALQVRVLKNIQSVCHFFQLEFKSIQSVCHLSECNSS